MDVNQNIVPFSYFQDLLEIDKSKILINQFINDYINEQGERFLKGKSNSKQNYVE